MSCHGVLYIPDTAVQLTSCVERTRLRHAAVSASVESGFITANVGFYRLFADQNIR